MSDDNLFFGQPKSQSITYYSQKDKTLEGALASANNILGQLDKTYSDVYFQFNWLEFRLPECIFNLSLSVKFVFERHTQEVAYLVHQTGDGKSDSQEVIFKSLYKTEYDHAQIHEINYQLANKVYDFIAAKLAEADSPPA